METEFDKEMDTILRASSHMNLPKKDFDVHPDADEIAAFAENSVGEELHKLLSNHFADCDRCILILSNTISLNAEAVSVPVAESSAAKKQKKEVPPESPKSPWYQELFSGRNVVLVMSTLVLLMVTGMGYMLIWQPRMEVVQNSDSADSTGRSRKSEQMTMNQPEGAIAGDNEATENSVSVEVGTNSEAAQDSIAVEDVSSEKKAQENSGVVVNDDKKIAAEIAKPKGEPSQVNSANSRKQNAYKNSDESKSVAPSLAERSLATEAEVLSDRMPRTRQDGGAQIKPKAASPASKKSKQETRIGGKNFQSKGGVLTDSAYKNQPITNIKRESDAFKKLPQSVKSIAQKVKGTIIIVNNARAYRIY